MTDPVFLKHVRIRNYKSIADCSVDLGPLTFLVGPNGSGKSNFLDALRFVKDSLFYSVDRAIRERGGIDEIRRRSSGGHRPKISIELQFSLPELTDNKSIVCFEGEYSFQISSTKRGGFEIHREECVIHVNGMDIASKNVFDRAKIHYLIESGEVKIFSIGASNPVPPLSSPDLLYLVRAANYNEFKMAFDALFFMVFYNIIPDQIRELQSPFPAPILDREGRGIVSVVRQMSPQARGLILDFLSKTVPGIVDISPKYEGKRETLEFLQHFGGNEKPLRFPAESMSDGTLRAFGILVALFQSMGREWPRVPLVGIEEPEVALHPGAAGVLRDALIMASRSTQVIVTSHSPDLLDDKEVRDDWILGVESVNGETIIGPIGEADRTAIRDRLFTAGELLRRDKLRPANAE